MACHSDAQHLGHVGSTALRRIDSKPILVASGALRKGASGMARHFLSGRCLGPKMEFFEPMTIQDLYLGGVIAAFAVFAISLAGVSFWARRKP